MDEFATEEEQIAHIKKWFKENGLSIGTGLMLGISVIYGGRAWFDYQDKQAGQAAVEYEQIIMAQGRNDNESVLGKAAALQSQYADTPYAALAAMTMARVEQESDNSELAQTHLKWAIDHAKPDSFKHVARQRLIRVLLLEGKLDEAEQLLNEAMGMQGVTKYFSAAYKGLQGDLSLARGDADGASKEFQAAADRLPQGLPYREFLELKRDNVLQSGSQE